MERSVYGATQMTTRCKTRFIHESRYVAEVEIEVIEGETSWSPYLSPQRK